jgi:Cu+-exporting ATPase
VDTVVMDKTGTVTVGRMSLVSVHVRDGVDQDELIASAAAVEHASSHPVARAVAEHALASAAPRPVRDFATVQGRGVHGVVDGRLVQVGRLDWLTAESPALSRAGSLRDEAPIDPVPEPLRVAATRAESAGRTPVWVARDGVIDAVLVVSDTVRPTSAAAVSALRDLGLRPVLLTGDNRAAAEQVAAAVGIDEVIAETLPEQKLDAIRALQEQGRVVAMIGDGINDAPALAQADLSLAMGTGTDVAIEASDLTLVRSDLGAAVDAIRLSRATLRTIKGNLLWAFGYNVAAIPLAASGLLSPMVAGAAMAFSSVFVVTNSLRLRRFRPAALG